MTRTYDEIVSYSYRTTVRKRNAWSAIRSSLNTLGIVLMVWAACVVTGALLFRFIEYKTTGVSWIDSFYWAVQVASTTGPGDVTPKTDTGKLLFIIYNLLVSVLLLLILGANIIARAIEDANALTHKEQEWSFFVQEQTYAAQAQTTLILFRLLKHLDLPLPPLLEGQDPVTGQLRPCPPQPHDCRS